MPVLFTREPVLNRNRAITATRFVAHARPGSEGCRPIVEELNRLSAVWPTSGTIFLGLEGCVPDEELLEWAAPENVVVEVPLSSLANPATLEVARRLQQARVPLCLVGYSAGASIPSGLEFRFVLAEATANLAGAPGLLLAQGIQDNAQFDACLEKGFGGACGWFFLKGLAPAKTLNAGQAQTIRLLNLVRANAEIRQIEAALKQDVALSVKLLRYINSAGFGLRTEVQSFRHAVTLLGYDKLNKWLSLLLVTSSKDAAAPALMQAAIARGRFMELTGAGHVDPSELDNLFITGAFSLLDTLLGVLMETALADLRLPDRISEALTAGSGPYASLLELAKATEQAQALRLEKLMRDGSFDAQAINQSLFEALVFADSLQAG